MDEPIQPPVIQLGGSGALRSVRGMPRPEVAFESQPSLIAPLRRLSTHWTEEAIVASSRPFPHGAHRNRWAAFSIGI